MGRKQRDMSALKPFCFYCQKSFKNEVILHHHQKAKHFSCPKCPKKFSSIDSMIQHCKSNHQQQIQRVPNANAGRDNVALKIFGMQGVPRIQIQSWISKNVNRYWGKIIERKMLKRKKQIKQLKNKEANGDNISQNMQQQKENNEDIAQNLDFPLQFNITEK